MDLFGLTKKLFEFLLVVFDLKYYLGLDNLSNDQ